jgi:malate dehydrogenase (oxaloacetate-decarboxylating)
VVILFFAHLHLIILLGGLIRRFAVVRKSGKEKLYNYFNSTDIMVEKEEALELHRKNPGKITVDCSVDVESKKDLSLVYTPGVAEPCKKISKDNNEAYNFTSKGNLVAVVSDGSAVLGLGDIGAEASMPVMEGKANLMKKFGEVDGFPVVLDSGESEEIIESVENISPAFGAINLEDICAPKCFKVEDALSERLDIPVFHDDQHGTAIVVKAALQNALDLTDRELGDSRIAIIGAGASGIAVAKFLNESGAGEIIPVDSSGILSVEDDNIYKSELAKNTLASEVSGGLEEALEDADAVIGLSTGGLLDGEMVESMADDPIVFALANPEPEIMPDEAREAGAEIVATGRSDFDNQVNNSLAFPGIFRGLLDSRASEVNLEIKKAASDAIRDFIEPEKDKIVPETLDKDLAMKIAERVEQAAEDTGVARK